MARTMDDNTKDTPEQQNTPEEDAYRIELARQRVWNVPLGVMDALVWERLPNWASGYAMKVRRRQLTTGSVLYTILTNSPNKEMDNKEVGKFTLRMMVDLNSGNQKTHFLFEPSPQIGSLIIRTFWFRLLPYRLSNYLADDQYLIAAVERHQQGDANLKAIEEAHNALKAAQEVQEVPKIGRPPRTDNEWARQEIQRGRDREEVFEEYRQRLRIDPADKEAVARAKDQFRKALSRTKGRK